MLPASWLAGLPAKQISECPAIYEPVHGSAPDIAGQGVANPIGTILSVGMLLEYSAGQPDCARRVDRAVDAALTAGFATPDLGGDHTTSQLVDAVIRYFRKA